MAISRLEHIHLFEKIIKLDISWSFCQAIGNHLICLDISQLDPLNGYLISNVIMLNVDMLSFRVKDKGVCQSY